GYSWSFATVKEEMSMEEMHRRLDGQLQAPTPARPAAIRPGFLTVTPYLVATDAEGLIDFVKNTFNGQEMFRDVGSAGGCHCEIRMEVSLLMIGGGGKGLAWKGEPIHGAFHVYVRDCDETYRRALQSGGESLSDPKDQEYGERSASVVDQAGNFWYIAT